MSDGRRRRGSRRHRDAGDLARRPGQDPRAPGALEEAETLARGAVALVAPTDLLSHHGDAMLDLAEVLRASSPTDEYHGAVQSALSLYEQKGNVIGAARARSLLSHRVGGT